MTGGIDAVIAPQILYEFYSVVTNPRRIEPPLSREMAIEICMTMQESPELVKITPSPNTPREAFSLVEEHGIKGAGVFDCVLAATAKENDVEAIYTQNVGDFERFDFLTVENPLGDGNQT